MQFESLNIIEPILKSLKEEGYTTPTPIQAQAIPIIQQGKDLTCAVVFGGVNQNPQTNELRNGRTEQRFNKSINLQPKKSVLALYRFGSE